MITRPQNLATNDVVYFSLAFVILYSHSVNKIKISRSVDWRCLCQVQGWTQTYGRYPHKSKFSWRFSLLSKWSGLNKCRLQAIYRRLSFVPRTFTAKRLYWRQQSRTQILPSTCNWNVIAKGKNWHPARIFCICVLTYLSIGKLIEIIYYHKPFSKNYNKPVDHFLFLLAVLPYR